MLIFLIVVVIGALTLVLDRMSSEKLVRINQRGADTQDSLAQAKAALLTYAVIYRDQNANQVFGYMPCPDFTGDGVADPNTNGRCNALDGQAEIGLLPYKTLGLADLRDSDGNCLWYAVAGGFKAATNKPVMNWDTQGQFSIVGTTVAPDQGDGGAAAVIFAPGAPLTGQSRTAGGQAPCSADPSQVSAHLDGGYNFATSSSIAITPGTVKDASGTVTNNDRLAWITPKDIFDAVRKRSDFATFVSDGINHIQAEFAVNLPAPAATAATLPANPFGSGTSDYNFYDSWKDNFRYLACNPAGSYCYRDASSNTYDGVLLFGGAHSNGTPRGSTARNNSDYFEGNALTLAGGSTAPACSASAVTFDNTSAATRAADFALCLKPEPPFVPTVITGTSGFAALAAPSTLVSSFESAGTLGSSVAPVTAASGCAWYTDKVSFENGIRIYFRVRISARDSGFVFTLADAGTNPATAGLCGGTVGYLGYAGTDAALSPGRIAPPKFGLEFDTRADSSPATDTQLSTYAGSTTLRHIAFDYWGTLATYNDDNTHRAGTLGSSTEPQNPYDNSSNLGVRNWSATVGTEYYARLDIDRIYDADTQTGTYTLAAYIYTFSGSLFNFGLVPSTSCTSVTFADLSSNLSVVNPNCNAYISRTIAISDSVSNGSEAMKQVYLGFTTGQRSGRTQQITISGFKAQNHQ